MVNRKLLCCYVVTLIVLFTIPLSYAQSTPPDNITDLTFTVISGTQVDLTWSTPNDNGSPITEYQIWRNLNDFGFSLIGTIADPLLTSFSDTTLSPASTVTYMVRAVNVVGNAGPSNVPAPVTTEGSISLRLIKEVSNDNGGSAISTDFTLSADGPTPISGAGGAISDDTFLPGTYTLSETGPDGYDASQWVCVGGVQSANQITIEEGESAICTITNDDFSDDLLEGLGDIIFLRPQTMHFDSAGDLNFPDALQDLIKKFDSSGQLLMGFNGSDGGFGFEVPSEIVFDSLNNFYVVDTDRIQKFDEFGNLLLVIGNGEKSSDPGQFDTPRGLALDSQDNLYVADGNNNRIQKFDSNGNFVSIISSGGMGPGNVRLPFDVTFDSQDFLYVADTGNNRIQKFDTDGNFIVELGQNGSDPSQFNRPRSLVVDSEGSLYVADTYNHRVQKFDQNLIFLWEIGSLGSDPGEFGNPGGVAISNGNLYVFDQANDRIQIFDSSNGNFISEFRSGDSPMEPYFSYLNSSGELLVADGHNHKILTFNPDTGELLSSFGNLGSNPGEFRGPRGIDTDLSGNIYVSDNYNNRVQKFDSNGNFLLEWGTTGINGGEFRQPRGLAIDSNGFIQVADNQNNRIQMFDQFGNFLSTFFSDSPYQISIDSSDNVYSAEIGGQVTKYDDLGNPLLVIGPSGPDPIALSFPKGVISDSNNNIFVVDSGKNRFLKFDSEGTLLIERGNGASELEQYSNPRSAEVDSSGNVWLSDAGNGRVQNLDNDLNFIKEIFYDDSGIDLTPPVVSVPQNITEDSQSPSGNTINYSGESAVDLIDGMIDTSCSPESGSLFPNGETIVECSATDSSGNTGNSSFLVTVNEDSGSDSVAHYPFEDSLEDSTGNGNTGTINAGGTETYVAGPDGQAFEFDGDTLIETSDTPFDFERTDSFSLSYWIKTDVANITDFLVGKIVGGMGYQMNLNSNNEIKARISNSNPDKILVQTIGADVRDNQWHHIVMTYDGTSSASGVTVYVDGTSAPLSTNSDSLTQTIQNDIPLVIGNKDPTGPKIYTGNMDDLRIYDFELSQDQITNIFTLP